MDLVGIGLIVCGVGIVVAAGLLVRYAKLPPWTHRDLLAFLALVGTIGGAVILTFLKWDQAEKFDAQADRLITELVTERKNTLSDTVGESLRTIFDALAWDHKLTSVGIIVVLLSLGLVISSRVIKGKFMGGEFEMGGGSEAAARAAAAAAAQSTAGAAQDRAEEITDQIDAPPPPPPGIGAGPPEPSGAMSWEQRK